MTRAPKVPIVQADVRELEGTRLRVAIRSETGDLFGAIEVARQLGVQVGDRVVVQGDYETLAADVIAVDGPAIELQLVAALETRPKVVTLRRPGGFR